MNIFLEADYKTYTAFCPVYSPGGLLTSVEMLTHFTHASANVAMPQEILTPLLNDRQRVLLLQEQINVIEKHYDFFSDNDLKVAINIDKPLAETILESEFILKKMCQLDCLELEVSESFPDLTLGRNNNFLKALSEKFNLSLNNYGAGKATSKLFLTTCFIVLSWIKDLFNTILNAYLFTRLSTLSLITSNPTVRRLSCRAWMTSPGYRLFVTMPSMVFRARYSRRSVKRR
ncbi:hypothetical protein [Erwinia rhapontici]|uniref:hypothetical protein n=1 Tax=Erwinia rhapontici TaxID=55212 RepID=UPI001D5737AC|nr:hypothetical protein [Erwinia rhapontici]MBP2155529.1 hypothetical protein [Erwinia rhapontici]